MNPITIPAGDTTVLPANVYTKEGYDFIGWNTKPDNSGGSYADKARYAAAEDESKEIILYAQWKILPEISDLVYMQDFAKLSKAGKNNVLESMPEGQQYQLKDSRDQKVYYISKLADNNIWMTQNLDLNIEAGKTYTSADTDLANSKISTNWTPTASTSNTLSDWILSYTIPSSYDPGNLYWNGNITTDTRYTTINDRTVTSPLATPGGDHYHIGNYYNWTATIAMNDSSSYYWQKGRDVNQSICPAGWRLPVLTGDKSYEDLVNSQDLSVGVSGNIHNNPAYFVYSGTLTDDRTSAFVGFGAYYWYGTVQNVSNSPSFRFQAKDNYINFKWYPLRRTGISIRCVAR